MKRVGMLAAFLIASQALAVGCGGPGDSSNGDASDGGASGGDASADGGGTAYPPGTDPFADQVITFAPGSGATFGQDRMPDVVLGPPVGQGASAGSLDVVSLGEKGTIVLAFDDLEAVDGDGPDLIVFENPFSGWIETGVVSASIDGETWYTWPCDASNAAAGYPGCAGVHPVFSNPDNGIDPTDPAVAGGDAFDLADIGLPSARYIRIEDSGANTYGGAGGGIDLDAVTITRDHWREIAQ
jgi:hypothetical protein